MEVDNTSWKKKLTPQQKAEYKAEKREEMQNLFKKIDDGEYFMLRKALNRTKESTISLHGKHQRATRKALAI